MGVFLGPWSKNNPHPLSLIEPYLYKLFLLSGPYINIQLMCFNVQTLDMHAIIIVWKWLKTFCINSMSMFLCWICYFCKQFISWLGAPIVYFVVLWHFADECSIFYSDIIPVYFLYVFKFPVHKLSVSSISLTSDMFSTSKWSQLGTKSVEEYLFHNSVSNVYYVLSFSWMVLHPIRLA